MNAYDARKLMADYPRVLPVAGTLVALALMLALVTGDSTAQKTGEAVAATAQSEQLTVTPGTDPESSASNSVSAPRVIQVAAATAGTDRAAVETIIRDYLLQNPEILLELQQALEIKMNAEREEQARVAMTENAAQIFRSPADPVIGNKDGDITVVEFFDYNCPFCRKVIPDLEELISTDKNVKIVMKEFPIFGEESEQAAYAALAAGRQGKYWEMHRALLEKPGRANKQKALTIARELNLDIAKLEADMVLPEVRTVVEDAQRLGQKMGIQGTPHFLIGPLSIPGAPDDLLDQMKSRIAQVRKDGCTVC